MRVTPGTLVPAVLVLLAGPLAAQAPVQEVRERIRARIEGAELPGALAVGGDRLHARAALARFYEHRTFTPVWVGARGPAPPLDELVSLLNDADDDGLQPSDYHVTRIANAVAEAREQLAAGVPLDPGFMADLELLATDGFLMFASHMALGRVDPEALDSKWVANRRDFDATVALERGLAQGLSAEVSALRPSQEGYSKLRDAYRRYLDLAAAGGWSTVPDGPPLEVGARGPRVAALRRRLAATGDLTDRTAGSSTDVEVFDESVDRAVRDFQRRHGLGDDGVAGPATLAALNVPAAERASQIWINLERWRWLPADLGRRHVIVNSANFELDLVEDGREVFTSRVMVGRPYRRTPVFSDRIAYLVLNPYWNVPQTLAVQDQVPAQKRDREYFQRVGMRIFDGWGEDAAEIDPASIDWDQVPDGRFSYRLRQDPGPENFLGKVKIMFPNDFNVYLHDTPARALFSRSRRDFSSGCIRVEKAIELTELLLRDLSDWDRNRIQRSLELGREETVRLAAPVPVHLLYWTAWVGSGDEVHFRTDIYDRDPELASELGESPPGPGG